jgi:hypothetical protein
MIKMLLPLQQERKQNRVVGVPPFNHTIQNQSCRPTGQKHFVTILRLPAGEKFIDKASLNLLKITHEFWARKGWKIDFPESEVLWMEQTLDLLRRPEGGFFVW